MRSRQSLAEFIHENFNIEVVPKQHQDHVYAELLEVVLDKSKTRAELARSIFLGKCLGFLKDLPHKTIAEFLKVSEPAISKAFAQVKAQPNRGEEREMGRPSLMSEKNFDKLVTWVRTRCDDTDFPTLNEFREEAYSLLEAQDSSICPSLSYYDSLLSRVLERGFRLKSASPLDEDRWKVEPETISEHFRKLIDAGILECIPAMIINIDETGFGASRSGILKAKQVIVPDTFEGTPVYEQKLSSHFITGISAISLAGDVFQPALVTTRGSDHPDAEQCSWYEAVKRYQSENAFVTRDVFTKYLREIILPHIAHMRVALNDPTLRGFVIFDGHKSHLCKLAKAICASENITLYLLPAHSSHLCQPLDRGFFRSLNGSYARMRKITGLSKISGMCERIYGAYQASSVIRTVWDSWSASGFVPLIQKGRCVGFTLDPDQVLKRGSLQHPAPAIKQGEIGRKVASSAYGVLNEDEMLIYDAGQCPFCCQPLE
jgi:hypothetical protein